MCFRTTLLALTAILPSVLAHGYVRTWTLASTPYPGYSNTDRNFGPPTIGWSYNTPDEGPELSITSTDFICRSGGTPAQSYGTVSAGSTATFFWTSDNHVANPSGWNPSHKGPIITYIAPCPSDCTTVDKTQLNWTKIAASGYSAGTWATDTLISNGGTHTITIPSALAPAKYVLRHEIIALHLANMGQPEFYMHCGNIEVTGSGTDNLANQGVVATSLYSTSDTQLFGFDVHDMTGSTWNIPGPPLYAGASNSSTGSAGGSSGSGNGVSSALASGSGGSSTSTSTPSSDRRPGRIFSISSAFGGVPGNDTAPPSEAPEKETTEDETPDDDLADADVGDDNDDGGDEGFETANGGQGDWSGWTPRGKGHSQQT